jgi:uncharacterized membrane protein YkoI
MKMIKVSRIAAASVVAFGLTTFSQQQQTLTVEQLPAAVQNVIKTETKNGPVNNIQQLTRNGRTVYQIGLKQPNGEKNIYLNADGSYFQDTGTSVASGAARSGRTFDVKMEQLPQNVQNVIKSETSNGAVKRIQQMAHNGRSIYKVSLEKSGGGEKLIYLNKDGTYVQDQPQSSVGAPAASSTGSRGSLSNATKVTFDKVPAAAQKAIQAAAGSAAIEDIDKGMLNGKTVYEAAFKQNGNTVELRVDEQGNVIQDTQDQSIVSNQKK